MALLVSDEEANSNEPLKMLQNLRPLSRGEVAIEVKGSSRIENSDLRPLKAFIEEYRPKKTFVVCNEHRPRVHEHIHIQPWRNFLAMLWNGFVIS